MFGLSTFRHTRHIFASCVLGALMLFSPEKASGQSLVDETVVDPRLVELVEIVKSRSEMPIKASLRDPAIRNRDEVYIAALEELIAASYSHTSETIFEAVKEFETIYSAYGSLDLSRIPALFNAYAQGLEEELTAEDLQIIISYYFQGGNWFEKYVALELSGVFHSMSGERQAALGKVQLALAVIPQNAEIDAYAKYAKVQITETIAHLHNLQGNSDLALEASLDYLNLTRDKPNLEDEIDLINNLIFSYKISRNHDAQLFLSEHLLELEKTRSSSVPGLSEMRIASVMNAAGRFEAGLDYSNIAYQKTEHPLIKHNSEINKAIALAGMGQKLKSKEVIKNAKINLARETILQTENSEPILYLAFLLAQDEDPAYAAKIYNRQHDVLAQNFLSNNSRDTTSMLAALENTRERQAERDAAAAREAELQALTIDRQRKLNRTLMFLLTLLAAVALAAMCFARYRSRMVTELEIKTKEAASAEKLKTDFLGMISHELRTPLNGIIGISDFLANYHEDPDIQQKTGIILRSGNELLTVVESLTDMARLDAGQLELAPYDADLNQSLTEAPKAWAAKAKDKGLVFTSFIDPSLTQHHVDGDRLLQCLNILMENAVRFTDAGRVHLHITANQSDQNVISGLTAVVADTGQGMTELVQSRLFTPFMQADTSRKRTHMGTGLSLAIAYALAEIMGGTLSVVSRKGRGSEFTLNIPLEAAEAPQKLPLPELSSAPLRQESVPSEATAKAETVKAETLKKALKVSKSSVSDRPVLEETTVLQREVIDLMTPRVGSRSLHNMTRTDAGVAAENPQRILIVDDIDDNREALRYILEAHGHMCDEASDGFAALAKLNQQPYDFMILDIHMSPLDGVGTLRRIRGSKKPYAYIPVIALTADNAARTNAACMDAGADLFLTKPVQRTELMAAMNYLNQTDGARILSR